MIVAVPVIWLDWAALKRQAFAVMEIILHIGAHRTGTTTFQDYMRNNAQGLETRAIGFWGPRRTRAGLFAGLQPAVRAANGRDIEKHAIGRVKMNCARAEGQGRAQLVISDENMIGTIRANLHTHGLYHAAGERMARYAQAFTGRKTRVFLSIRSLDTYWASALGYAITRGCGVPSADSLDRLVTSRRRWRDVITDVACAVPDADISVLPFETFGGQPDTQLALMTGGDVPRTHARGWVNATPHAPALRAILERRGEDASAVTGTGRWQPFDAQQVETLRETYLDDLFWLHSGADGLATITTEHRALRTGNNPAGAWTTKGHPNDTQERAMV
jgi:hypothetical protein